MTVGVDVDRSRDNVGHVGVTRRVILGIEAFVDLVGLGLAGLTWARCRLSPALAHCRLFVGFVIYSVIGDVVSQLAIGYFDFKLNRDGRGFPMTSLVSNGVIILMALITLLIRLLSLAYPLEYPFIYVVQLVMYIAAHVGLKYRQILRALLELFESRTLRSRHWPSNTNPDEQSQPDISGVEGRMLHSRSNKTPSSVASSYPPCPEWPRTTTHSDLETGEVGLFARSIKPDGVKKAVTASAFEETSIGIAI